MGCGHSALGKLADAPIVRGEFVPLTRDDPARSISVYRILFSGISGYSSHMETTGNGREHGV